MLMASDIKDGYLLSILIRENGKYNLIMMMRQQK